MMAAADPPQEKAETLLPALEPSDAKHIRETHEGLHAEVRDGGVYVRSQRKVGAVGVPSGASFYIRPKVECSLLHMLAFSDRIDDEIVFDAEEAGFDIGDSFVELIAQMLIHELRRIFQRGLDQQYKEQQERLQHLRGRLDLPRQLQQGPGTMTFECVFDDLTHDTQPNHLLYHAAETLRRVVSNEAIAGQLQRYCKQLKAAFEPQPLGRAPAEELQLSHINRYYERGIELAKFILQEHYVQGFAGQHQDLSSFVVDMPVTFEDAIYQRLKTAVSSSQLRVTQEPSGTLATEAGTDATRDLEPDFTIEDRNIDDPVLVGDIKWKHKDGVLREDLHQMFAYQAKVQTPGLLIYPDADQQLPTEYEFQGRQMKQSLFTLKLDISDSGFKQTRHRIDEVLRETVYDRLRKAGQSLLPAC